MTTHRCKGSLAAKASIRYEKFFKYADIEWDKPKWYLSKWYEDSEWGVWGQGQQIPITYCPFCGEKLEEYKGE